MNKTTLLLRQVNPAWIQAGRVTSQVFRPTQKDQHQLSVYNGALITPQNAWNHFTDALGRNSIGVLAVSVEECYTQGLEVRSDPDPFPEHAVIDFGTFGKGDIDRKAKHLRANAEARGWLYRAE